MKRKIGLLLAVAICILLAACNKEPELPAYNGDTLPSVQMTEPAVAATDATVQPDIIEGEQEPLDDSRPTDPFTGGLMGTYDYEQVKGWFAGVINSEWEQVDNDEGAYYIETASLFGGKVEVCKYCDIYSYTAFAVPEAMSEEKAVVDITSFLRLYLDREPSDLELEEVQSAIHRVRSVEDGITLESFGWSMIDARMIRDDGGYKLILSE